MLRQTQLGDLRRVVNRKPVRVLAVCSGKGGVGKTNVAANVAIALAARHRNVCLLDADVSLANVDVLLGIQPRFNLSHVVSGETGLAAALLRGPNNIQIVPAASGNFEMTELPLASQAALIQAFGELPVQPDILVVDTAAGISPTVARFVAAAQHAVVVVCDEPASLTDAYALMKIFSRHYGISRFQVVTNRSRSAAAGKALFSKLARVANSYLDIVLHHLGDIPGDDYLLKAVQQQRAVVDVYPKSPAGRAFQRVARAIDELPLHVASKGGIEFFFERLLMADKHGRGMVA